MNSSFKIIYAVIIFFSISACDDIDNGIITNFGKEISSNTPTDTTSAEDTIEVRVRKVLVEDFTGHQCPNCPKAAVEIKNLEALYGEKVVPMALHVSTIFAEPVPPTFPADYRTSEGNEIDDFFNISAAGLPKGMINRRGYPTNNISPYLSWSSEVSNIINTPLDAWISMKNTYNESLNKVTTDLKIDFENTINDEVKLCVFLIQDSIISPQKDVSASGGKILDYVHMHMLRKGLTPAFGDLIATNPNTGTPEVKKSYSLVLQPDWKAEHCKIIAYIYKVSNYEIIQAQEKHVK